MSPHIAAQCIISVINVQVNKSPKYHVPEHGKCSRERKDLHKLCSGRSEERKTKRPCLYTFLVVDYAMQKAEQTTSETAGMEERKSVTPNLKCGFFVGLPQYFTFFPTKLRENSANTSQMKHCKLTWE